MLDAWDAAGEVELDIELAYEDPDPADISYTEAAGQLYAARCTRMHDDCAASCSDEGAACQSSESTATLTGPTIGGTYHFEVHMSSISETLSLTIDQAWLQ